mgnify:CR=1 FL=1
MADLRENFKAGTLTAQLAGASTPTGTLTAGLSTLPVVAAPDFVRITLDPEGANGAPEIVYLTAHTAGNNSGTVLRAQEGTSARTHNIGTVWRVTATKDTFERPQDLVELSIGTSDHLGSSRARRARIYDAAATVDGAAVSTVLVEHRHSHATAAGGETRALEIVSAPTLNVTTGLHAGLTIDGAPVGSTAPSEQTALRVSWVAQVGVTTPSHTGAKISIGVVGGTITEARALDIDATQFLGAITKAVGLRISALAGTTSWSVLAAVPAGYSQVQGKTLLGGTTIETVPAARLQIVETVPGARALRVTTEATDADLSDPTYDLIQADPIETTDATVTTAATFTTTGTKAWLITATVIGRRSAGGTGTDYAAVFIRRAVVQQISGAADFLGEVIDVHTATANAAWDADLDVTGTDMRVRVTGAASTTITWNVHLEVWELGA